MSPGPAGDLSRLNPGVNELGAGTDQYRLTNCSYSVYSGITTSNPVLPLGTNIIGNTTSDPCVLRVYSNQRLTVGCARKPAIVYDVG